MNERECRGRGAHSGLILLMPHTRGTRTGENPDRETLFAAGFQRMGWPAYDPAMLRRTAKGKPVYIGDDSFYLNYSDIRDICGAAFAPVPVGIDLETPRRRSAALLRRLPQDEQKYLYDAADETECDRRFLRMWTAKEAFGKMEGSGITKEILETSFVQALGRTRPAELPAEMKAKVRGNIPAENSAGFPADDSTRRRRDEVCLRLPAAGTVRMSVRGTDCFLTQFYAGVLTVSVCTMHKCMFEIAFSEQFR